MGCASVDLLLAPANRQQHLAQFHAVEGAEQRLGLV